MTSRKVLAIVDTADFSDCVATGYRYTLYADGRVAADYRSRWQGSESGARYSTEAGEVDLSDMDASDPDNDAEAILTAWIKGENPMEAVEYGSGNTWRQTRRGSVVR